MNSAHNYSRGFDKMNVGYNWQGVCGAERYSSGSVIEAARRIINQEGPAALLCGVRARVLFHTPAAAICWSTYEAAKQFLQKWNEEHRPFSVPQILKQEYWAHWRFDLFLKREENDPGGPAMTRFVSNMVMQLSEAYLTVSVNSDP